MTRPSVGSPKWDLAKIFAKSDIGDRSLLCDAVTIFCVVGHSEKFSLSPIGRLDTLCGASPYIGLSEIFAKSAMGPTALCGGRPRIGDLEIFQRATVVVEGRKRHPVAFLDFCRRK